MIKAIAIDDEPLALQVIERLASDLNCVSLEKTFTNTEAARNYIGTHPVDLIFLDIHMPSVNGIRFYQSLQQSTMVIFTTAHSEYALKGFEVNAIDYLLKPIAKSRFESACIKALRYYEHIFNRSEGANDSLYVRSEYALVKIPYADIMYLETMDDYIKIHQVNKKPTLTLLSMKKMEDLLPKMEFVRVHRSYIVALSRIEAVRGSVVLVGAVEIPIGISFRKGFFKKYGGLRQ